jgi:DNA-binding NarL/FixJ family response regulator
LPVLAALGGVFSQRFGDVNGAAGVQNRGPVQLRDERAVIRLLIVDDHVVVRRGLELLFATVPEIEVVGVAANGEQAVAQARQLVPDVVLMDLSMSGVDGVEATRQIAAAHPASRIVVLTAYGDQGRLQAALRAGAAGYLLKHADPESVIRAVRVASAGGRLPGRASSDRSEELGV